MRENVLFSGQKFPNSRVTVKAQFEPIRALFGRFFNSRNSFKR